MNIKEMLKKHWFVAILSIFFIFAIGFLASDALKNDISAKKTDDGKDVVFSYADKDYTADDLYDEIFETLDIGVIIPVLELEIYRDATEVSKAMRSDSEAQAKEIINSLKANYGEDWEKALNSFLIQSAYVSKTGEKGLVDYLIIMEIRNSIEKQYVIDNPEIYEDFKKEANPRLISHILVKMADPDNPTEEESKKLADVKAELAKENANFADVATKYSDDGSKENGGSLGIVTKESVKNFVQNFQDNVYTKDTNETTEWFKTEYGYHIIRVDATSLDDFIKLNNNDIFDLLFESNPKILLDITWNQVLKQDITFGDNEELNEAIKNHYQKQEEN